MRWLIAILLLIALPGFAQVTIRGTPTIAGNPAQTTTNLSLPVGAAAGDVAIVSVANPNVVAATSGWTSDGHAGANISGITQYRALVSGDISAGFVSITCDPSFPSIMSLTVIVGPSISRIRELAGSQNGTGASSRTLTTGAGTATTDVGIFFSASRGGTSSSISPGTSVGTATSTFINGRLATDAALSSGANVITFNYSGSSGDYQSFTIVNLALISTPKSYPILY